MPSFKATQEMLLAAIDEIRNSGSVAPTGVTISPYAVIKKRRDGTTKEFHYYKVESNQAIFNAREGKTKYLHLGKLDSKKYTDWKARIARRNAIAALEQAATELILLEQLQS